MSTRADLSPSPGRHASGQLKGVAAGLGAHLCWGIAILFWIMLKDMPAVSIMAHRMIWSCLFLLLILSATRRWGEVSEAIRDRRTFTTLATNAAILSFNWSLFLWAVNRGNAVETSLGYYITPLLNVIMGRLLLGEKISRFQALAILLVALGVSLSMLAYGHVPWVAFALALSFAVYGYLQKTIRVEAAPSLFVETAVLLPFALAWLAFNHPGDLGMGGHGAARPLLLVSTICFTAVPLLLFSYAARHINLSTIGILQYVSPSMTFVLAVLVNGEQIKASDMVTFPLIWIALVVYTWDAVRAMRRMSRAAREAGHEGPA